MKTINHLLLFACLSAGTYCAALAAQAAADTPTNEAPAALAATNPATAGEQQAMPTPAAGSVSGAVAPVPAAGQAPNLATDAAAGANPAPDTNALTVAIAKEPPVIVEDGTNGLRLNFHNAPLSLVLDYLSDAAGFVINKEADVRGTLDVQGKDLTREEAVEVLNSTLKKNGYAVIRNGRILTIVAQDTAKTKDLEIVQGNDPETVEKSNEVVTQIIPVRYASVSQLVPNLELLLPSTATLTANESANSLILVATKTDIKRMLKIISALDTSIASVSTIRVLPLKYADAKETATLITQLFSSQASGQGSSRGSLFNMFGGGGPFGGPPGFGDRGRSSSSRSSSGSANGRGAAAAQVVAVGDDRSNSVVISAPADLLDTIETMVEEIDQEVTDVTELRVFRLLNADPTEIADQLATLFPDTTGSTSAGSQSSMAPFFFRGSSTTRRGGSASDSDRAKKMGRVLAVADPRTSSLIVMASKALMPQIADMIAELDSDKGRKEVVGFYDLQNADPQDVQMALEDLFNRNTRMNNNNQNTMLGQNNPLTRRVQQNQQTTAGRTSGRSSGTSRGSSGIGF